MKAWQAKLERRLAQSDAPAVLSRDLLARFARSVKGADVPVSTLTHLLKRLVDYGKLQPVKNGLFLNGLRPVPGQPVDATPWLYPDAIVSLNWVLGDTGVLNNPSNVITAVVPVDTGYTLSRLGRQATKVGIFHFFGIPRRFLEAGKLADRLEQHSHHDYIRATPEKALLDWLYLANSPRSRRTLPPKEDIDMTMLSRARLNRLAKAGGMVEMLASWQR